MLRPPCPAQRMGDYGRGDKAERLLLLLGVSTDDNNQHGGKDEEGSTKEGAEDGIAKLLV